MLHIAPAMCWKRPFLTRTQIFSQSIEHLQWGWNRSLRVFVGLNAKDNVLVGTASRLLAQEQTRGQARWLAHHGHVVCSPRLAVFVHHSQTPAGGAVPDALPRPNRQRTENVNTADRWAETHRNKLVGSRPSVLTRRGQLKHPGHQRSRWVSWDWFFPRHHWKLTASS